MPEDLSDPEQPATHETCHPGLNIARYQVTYPDPAREGHVVTETILLPYLHIVNTHPSDFLPQQPSQSSTHCATEIVSLENLKPPQRQRLESFLQTKLPTILAVFLALNTQEPVENWQFLQQECVAIALCGLSDSGKTTIATGLAEKYFIPVIDLEFHDPTQIDKPSSVRQSLATACQQLKTMTAPFVTIEGPGYSRYGKDRPLDDLDSLLYSAAEVRILVFPFTEKDDGREPPTLQVLTHETGVSNLGPISIPTFMLTQGRALPQLDPETFFSMLQTWQEPHSKMTITETAREWKQALYWSMYGEDKPK